MTWVDELRENGWTVGVAHGCAEVERERLDALLAVKDAAPPTDEVDGLVERLRGAFAASRDIVTKDRLGNALAVSHALVVLDDEVVAARAAVEAAEQMPTVYHLARDGVSLYVSDTDTDAIASLLAASE